MTLLMKHKKIILVLAALFLLTAGHRPLSAKNGALSSMLHGLIAVADSIDYVVQDSVATDSTKKESSGDVLDAPVKYIANDSMVWSRGGNAYLYGSGQVNYDKIELTADVISMNMDSSVVHAVGRADTLGQMIGQPIFKDGGTPYETNRISYNFKSKKGKINNVYTQQGDGFMLGKDAKKDSNNVIYIQNGKYTTCDADHPHFYGALTRAKTRP